MWLTHFFQKYKWPILSKIWFLTWVIMNFWSNFQIFQFVLFSIFVRFSILSDFPFYPIFHFVHFSIFWSNFQFCPIFNLVDFSIFGPIFNFVSRGWLKFSILFMKILKKEKLWFFFFHCFFKLNFGLKLVFLTHCVSLIVLFPLQVKPR